MYKNISQSCYYQQHREIPRERRGLWKCTKLRKDNMKEKIEDKLQYIKDAGFELTDYETVDMLSTLIQEERKEAVRGFVDKIRNEMGGKQFSTNPKDEKKEEAMHISYNWAISDMVRLLETYLQSLDKGDTE